MINYQKILDWLNKNNLYLTEYKFQYNYQDKIIELSLNEVLKAALERTSESQIIQAFEKHKAYYLDKNWWGRKEHDPLKSLIQEISCYLQDMANHKIYENHKDMTWKELSKYLEMDESFLKWWAKEKGISDRQMLCEHDSQDQFSEEGQFYNSTGVCIKCLIDTHNSVEESSDLDLIYKAWKYQP